MVPIVFRGDRLILLLAVWLVALVALAGLLLGLPATASAGFVIAAAAAATGIVASHLAGRRARFQRVSDFARQLLADSQPAAPAPGPMLPLAAAAQAQAQAAPGGVGGAGGAGGGGSGGGRGGGPEESDLDGLRRTLGQLGRRIEQQVKEVAKKSRNLVSLIDSLEDPVLATGEGELVLFCNSAAERLLGVEAGRLIGRNVRELFTRQELLAMHEAARAGSLRRDRLPIMTAAGQRTFQVSACPLPAAWGGGVFGAVLVLRDVTELAQAVQVKTDFVANASHELRTPVAAIRVAVETLLDGAKDDPSMSSRLLTMIAAHAQRLEEMIRDLMDLSRLETPDLPVRPGPVDVADVEQTLRQVFEPALRQRRLSLAFELDARLDGTRTDPKLLLLILRNLVDNATKYAYEETTIRVRGQWLPPRGPGERPPPSARTAEDGVNEPDAATFAHWPIARFEVADRGVGIPLAMQERVFERFYQVDQARSGVTQRRGTGLGLAIVKHACKALGGRVGIESVWGQGTTVWAEIPVEPPEAEAEPEAEVEADPKPGARDAGLSG